MEQEKLNFNIRLAIRHCYRILYARVIANDIDWQSMREIRNSLAHEYLDDINSHIELLNHLFETKGLEIIKIFKDILDYVKAKMYSNIFEDTKIEINKFYETIENSDFSDFKS